MSTVSNCLCGAAPGKWRSQDMYRVVCCNSQCPYANPRVEEENGFAAIAVWNEIIREMCSDFHISYEELNNG